jgi:hypothetical protein
MVTIENLLDQHDSYDLGGGWSVSRISECGQWAIYIHGKHLDCWEAEYNGESIPNQEKLTLWPNAMAAIRGAQSIRQVAPYPTEKKQITT